MLLLNIDFRSKKLEKCCNDYKTAVKIWGNQYADKVYQRLNELRAAVTLSDISHLPPAKCHELDGQRADQFAVTTKQPARLIFKPDHEPIPKKYDGGIDRNLVTDILILEVEDYHGKAK